MGRIPSVRPPLSSLSRTSRHAHRYRNRAPSSADPVGDPPLWLGDGARAAWIELADLAADVLCVHDRVLLEIAAVLLAEQRADPARFPVSKFRQLRRCLIRMGL
jgi:hypothetical protein